MALMVRFSTATLLGVCVLAGCGGGSDGPKLVPAKGKVTQGGQPLGNVVLQFVPEKGPMSAAKANAQGEFVMNGPGGKEGVIPGTFKVTVTCPFNPAGGSSADGSAPVATAAPCNIPAKLSVPDTTSLSVTVPPEGKTDLVIEVPAS